MDLDLSLNGCDHGPHDFILHEKDVVKVPIVPVGPDMGSRLRVDQLRGHAHPGTGLSQAPLNQVGTSEFTADQFDVDQIAPIGKA